MADSSSSSSSETDPSGFLPNANGGKPILVKVIGIIAKPEMNGKFAQPVSYSAGRYIVAFLESASDPVARAAAARAGMPANMVRLKAENLVKATYMEQLQVGAKVSFDAAKSFVNDPATRQKARQKYADFAARLPPTLKPEYVAIAALLVLVTLIRFIGFYKFITASSLVGMVAVVTSPDWTDGKPAKLVAKNFPKRWRDNVVAGTGYTSISERMALGIFAALVLFTGKVLMTPAGRPRPAAMNTAGSGPPMPEAMHGDVPQQQQFPNYDPEYLYKLGFDDASTGKEFGTSLPQDIAAFNDAPPQDWSASSANMDSDMSWAYDPPPPAKTGSGFGMGTMMSLFALFRFGKDVVTGPGGNLVWEPNYIMMKLKSTEPWRLGLIGFSLYRLVNAFM